MDRPGVIDEMIDGRIQALREEFEARLREVTARLGWLEVQLERKVEELEDWIQRVDRKDSEYY